MIPNILKTDHLILFFRLNYKNLESARLYNPNFFFSKLKIKDLKWPMNKKWPLSIKKIKFNKKSVFF